MLAPGPARAPIQAAGNVLVATFQDRELGGVALLGIEPESAVVVWKTVVGSPWPTDLARVGDSGGLSTLGRDGREVIISAQQAARGGFVVLPVPRPGAFALPAGLRLILERDGKPLSIVVPRPYSKEPLGAGRLASRRLARDGPARDGRGRPLGLAGRRPGPRRGCAASTWWTRSRAAHAPSPSYRSSTAITRATGSPPRSSIARPSILADDVGRVRRLVMKTTPVPRLTVEAERALDSRIVADPATTGAAVLVATADGRVRSLAARDLSPIGSWPLDASIAGRPVGLGDGGLAMDRAGGVLAFGRDGQKTWSIKLGAEIVGAPEALGRSLAILTSDGVLHLRDRSDGAPVDRRPLGVLPAGGPVAIGDGAMIPVAAGTVRPMALGSR